MDRYVRSSVLVASNPLSSLIAVYMYHTVYHTSTVYTYIIFKIYMTSHVYHHGVPKSTLIFILILIMFHQPPFPQPLQHHRR